MCISSLMIDPDARCLLQDLLDQVVQITNPSAHIILSPSLFPSKSIDSLFSEPIHSLNRSLRQLLAFELQTVVDNGQLSTTSTARHSRYYHPATAIKQANDLRKRLSWIQQRQFIIKQLEIHQDEQSESSNGINPLVVTSLESIWLRHRLQMLDCSLELIKEQNEIEEKIDHHTSSMDYSSLTCARCRIYERKANFDSDLIKRLKRQIRIDHDYLSVSIPTSGPDSDLILSFSKIADRIGHPTPSNVLIPSIESKKIPTTNRTSSNIGGFLASRKKQSQTKLQSSLSMMGSDLNRTTTKRTLDENRTISNSNLTMSNNELSNKRHKRIASPLSTLSVPSSSIVPIAPASPRDILTPSWRLLTNNDFESSSLMVDPSEHEDISDDAYIRRHIRCELEQESWIFNHQHPSNRKSLPLQTSLSAPNGLSSSNPKQYRYRLEPNGIAYTETIDMK